DPLAAVRCVLDLQIAVALPALVKRFGLALGVRQDGLEGVQKPWREWLRLDGSGIRLGEGVAGLLPCRFDLDTAASSIGVMPADVFAELPFAGFQRRQQLGGGLALPLGLVIDPAGLLIFLVALEIDAGIERIAVAVVDVVGVAGRLVEGNGRGRLM